MANNIIITGANQGIGYYMAEKLLADGNKVSVSISKTDTLFPSASNFSAI